MRPNILFLLTDDHRLDGISALGNPSISTPNMDALAERGTVFTNAYIPGGTCDAVCMPSRAMIHTSRNLFHLENHGETIPEHHRMLGEELLAQGYNCCGSGKWHNSPQSFARSFNDGGEIFFGGMWDHWNVPACHYDPTGKYAYSVPYITDAFHSDRVTHQVTDHITPGKHSTEMIADFAVDWIGDYRDDKPFFFYASFLAPHDPRSMPQRFRDMYDADEMKLPPNFSQEYRYPYGIGTIRDELLAHYPRTPEETKTHLADYYAMISHLDHEIGRIIQALKDQGVWDNTIVVFAGDNGLALGQHGLMGKQSAYEHSVRVPLLISGPGIARNRNDTPCYLMDIYPTLMDLLGVETPAGLEGFSLHRQLRGERPQKARESLFFAYADQVRAVSKDGYKLIEYNANGACFSQLFYLPDDPWETENLVDRQEFETVVRDLRQDLLKMKSDWEDLDAPVSRDFWNDNTILNAR